jgi:hypothetical protein
MGLIVSVYRDADGHDCTLNGVSSKVKKLTVINVPGPFAPNEEAPAAILERHHRKVVRIIPAGEDGKPLPGWSMFGGNYAACSDSRLSQAIEKMTGQEWYGAVAIHDRFE